jgi:hypothetical protein
VFFVDPSPSAEVLGQESTGSLTGLAWAWLRTHPVVLSALVIAAIGVVGVVLAGQVRSPRLPSLGVSDDGASPTTGPWLPGADERPAGPVVLAVTARIVSHQPGSAVHLLGIAGPGVRHNGSPPVDLSSGSEVTVPFEATVDCGVLPVTIPAGAYGLRVRVSSRLRSRTGVVGAGAVGERWRTRIVSACAAWSSRRDLTGTALAARVSPTQPQADLQLTLTNSGARPVTVTTTHVNPGIELKGDLPFVVPAHGSVQAALTVILRRCNDVGDPRSVNFPLYQFFVLTDTINLAGVAGALPPGVIDSSKEADTGLGPTGIVLDSNSGRALAFALVNACGLMTPSAISVAAETVRYDAASRVLSVPITVLTAPGRVRSLRLQAERGTRPEGVYLPVTTSAQNLVPDRRGQSRVTLRLHAPAFGTCPQDGLLLPDVLITLDVVGLGQHRTVAYSNELDLPPGPRTQSLPCANT